MEDAVEGNVVIFRQRLMCLSVSIHRSSFVCWNAAAIQENLNDKLMTDRSAKALLHPQKCTLASP